MAKTTTELLKELKRQSCSLPDYLSNHKDSFVNEDIKKFWPSVMQLHDKGAHDDEARTVPQEGHSFLSFPLM